VPTAGRIRYLEALPPPGRQLRGESERVLVLIHAFPLNARMWAPQLALAETTGWRILMPQLRGFDGGQSDPPAGSMDDYAGDVVDLLDALRIERAVIGGLSMGGYVAFALLRNAARYVQGLVLADTRPQADSPEGIEGRKRMLQLLDEKGVAAVAETMLPNLLGESTRRDRSDVVDRVRQLILSNPPQAVRGAITAMLTRPDSTPLLKTIHCPTLLMVGDEDTLTPRKLSGDMQLKIPGSELAIVTGAGHLSNMEQPALFNDRLARFLEHRV
jgi:pimeloyl-ACP methyl ester carboxylesterase